MAGAAWLEISPSKSKSTGVPEIDLSKIAEGSPIARVLGTLGGAQMTRLGPTSSWEYSLRLSTQEVEQLKEMRIFGKGQEDHRSIRFEVPISFHNVMYDLTLFIMK